MTRCSVDKKEDGIQDEGVSDSSKLLLDQSHHPSLTTQGTCFRIGGVGDRYASEHGKICASRDGWDAEDPWWFVMVCRWRKGKDRDRDAEGIGELHERGQSRTSYTLQ